MYIVLISLLLLLSILYPVTGLAAELNLSQFANTRAMFITAHPDGTLLFPSVFLHLYSPYLYVLKINKKCCK